MRKKTWNIPKRKREEDKSFVLIKNEIKLYTISGCSTHGLWDTIRTVVMLVKYVGEKSMLVNNFGTLVNNFGMLVKGMLVNVEI